MRTSEHPSGAPNDEHQRFYDDLQAVQEAGRDDAAKVLPVAEAQVEKHRTIVADLRSLLDQAEQALDRWATTAGELRATIDPDSAPVGAELRGKQISEVAVAVLEQSGKPQPLHYTDWLQLVRLAGYKIAGSDPQASFLTALHRDERIEPIGARTGLWKLAGHEPAEAA